MKSKTQRRVAWTAEIELDNNTIYREDISIKDIRRFTNVIKDMSTETNVNILVKDTIINKYVFPYIFNTYPKDRIASVSITKVQNE